MTGNPSEYLHRPIRSRAQAKADIEARRREAAQEALSRIERGQGTATDLTFMALHSTRAALAGQNTENR